MYVMTVVSFLHDLTVHVLREDRVRKSCEKLTKAVGSKQQGRIDGFFTVKPKENNASASKSKAKGGKDDSKTKSTKRKVGRVLCLRQTPTETFASRRRRRMAAAQRRQGRKSDLRSSDTYTPYSWGVLYVCYCISKAYLIYYIASLSPRSDMTLRGMFVPRFFRTVGANNSPTDSCSRTMIRRSWWACERLPLPRPEK